MVIGASVCTNVSFVSSSTVACLNVDMRAALGGTFPGAGNSTNIDVTLTVSGGQNGTLRSGITVIGPPTVTSVSPSVITPFSVVTIRGGVFGYSAGSVQDVKIGGIYCSGINLVDSSTVTVVAPNSSGLNRPVVVYTAGYVPSAASASAVVSYSVGQALVSSVSPNHGPTLGKQTIRKNPGTYSQHRTAAGGINISVVGVNLIPTNQNPVVYVGGSVCPVVVATSTSLICTLPQGEGYNLHVTVSSEPPSTFSMFSYDSATISALLSVPSGGYATIGGQAVVLQGHNFGAITGYVG